MTRQPDLLIRNTQVNGQSGCDVLIRAGRVQQIGCGLKAHGEVIEAQGGALLPGLEDRHLHLLATAAQRESVCLQGAADMTELTGLLGRSVTAAAGPGAWVRATGLNTTAFPEIDRVLLDKISPRVPVRVQDRTGALWILNSAALRLLTKDTFPAGVERSDSGEPTGRIWREDAWLARNLPRSPPSLAPIGAELARYGVTSVTDASASQSAESAALLADAHRRDDLPQRLTLMSAGPLDAPDDKAFRVGPVKLLLDERSLPDLETVLGRIQEARTQERAIAVHCVTASELALTLAAFEIAGSQPGDRIEHGSMICEDAIDSLRALGLTVVTQPGFIEARGDHYIRDIPSEEHANLYRCASLMAAGIAVYGSSDAPYGPLDPWAGMRAARYRRTRNGHLIGPLEQLTARRALMLYLGPPVRIGAPADLCLLKRPLTEALRTLSADNVAATLIGGAVVHQSTTEEEVTA